jgi:hypothetical protein
MTAPAMEKVDLGTLDPPDERTKRMKQPFF